MGFGGTGVVGGISGAYMTWRIAPAAVTASAAALGVSAALLTVIMGTYIAGNAGTLDGRPEPVKGLSMSKQNFDYWWDLGQEMSKLKSQANSESSGDAASSSQSASDPTTVKPNPKDNEPTDHAKDRREEARQGDPNRNVGDPNRVKREGKSYRDTETGYTVYVKGNRVTIFDGAKQVTQFKNSRRNTRNRVNSGRWEPIK